MTFWQFCLLHLDQIIGSCIGIAALIIFLAWTWKD